MQLTRPLAAVATGFSASVFLTGMSTSLSLMSTRPLSTLSHTHPAALSGRQLALAWQSIYSAGHALMPGLYILSGAIHLLSAWTCSRAGVEWRGAAAAGVLAWLVPPFTIAFIMPTNKAIAERTKVEAAAEEGEVRGLVEAWTGWNAARTVLPGLGAAAAAWNVVRILERRG